MSHPSSVSSRLCRFAPMTVLGLTIITHANIGFAQTTEPPQTTTTPAAASQSLPSKPAASKTPAPATSPQESKKGLFQEPSAITKAADFVTGKFGEANAPKDGIYPKFGTHMPGAGWIALGPGYRHHLWQDRVAFDAAGAVSWREYMFGEARGEMPHLVHDHLLVGAQALTEDWTQVTYFGAGPGSRLADISQYRLRASDFGLYASVHPGRTFDLRMRIGTLRRPSISTSTGWHNPGDARTQDLFTDATAPGLDAQPRFLHADVSITANTLDNPGHPAHGGLLQVAASEYRDQDRGQFTFRRYEVVGIDCVPLVPDLWTLAVRGTVIASDTSGGNRVPFYLLPSLGGQNLLRGYADDRFHDRDVLALNIESRWAIFTHVDAAVFTDLGEVAPTLGAFSRTNLLSSLGAGLRFHTAAATLVRLDVAHGGEGWRFVFKTSDSFSFSTLRRWATVLPIVP